MNELINTVIHICIYIYIYTHTYTFYTYDCIFRTSRHLKRLSECNPGTRAFRSNNHSPSGCRLKRKRWGISAVSVNGRKETWTATDMNFLSESFRILILSWCSMMSRESRIKVGNWNTREQSISSCFKLCMESLSLVPDPSKWNGFIAPCNLNYLRVPWGAFNFPNK